MNRLPQQLALLMLAAAAVAATPSVGADLTLREQVTPTGGLIRLGDLADIAASDLDEEARLAALTLMPAPAPGTQVQITAQGVREMIVATGVDLSTLRFAGAIRIQIGGVPSTETAPAPPQRTFVEEKPTNRPSRPRPQTGFVTPRKTQPEKPATKKWKRSTHTKRPPRVSATVAARLTRELQELIADFARQQSGNPLVEATVTEIKPFHLALLNQTETGVDIAITQPLAEGNQPFRIAFGTTDGPANFTVQADLRVARPAVFAVRAVPRGAVITRADVEVRPLPSDARLPSGGVLFGSADEVVGKEAGRALRPDTLLTDANCLPPLLVRRGEEVSVVAGGDGIRIRMGALARANGRLGEIVPIETLLTNERLSARVIGGRELAVLSAGPGAGRLATAALNRRVR